MIDIVKLLNGNVAIYDSLTSEFIKSLSPDIVEITCNPNNVVKVKQDNGSVEYFPVSNVSSTQVLPNAAIIFNGNCEDLSELLSTDFFFVVSGGGGGDDLATVLSVGNSAGTFDIDLNGNDLLNVGLINGIVFPQVLPIEIQAAASDETTALTAGNGKLTFRLPVAFTLTGVRASLTTAQTSGSIFTVDINQNGSSVLGTKLTIDNTEKTSVTAATPATITTSALTDDAEITIDIDQIGDGTAKGLKITLIGTR
jgi:hypothetical protein